MFEDPRVEACSTPWGPTLPRAIAVNPWSTTKSSLVGKEKAMAAAGTRALLRKVATPWANCRWNSGR
jgi:hypothetical protein